MSENAAYDIAVLRGDGVGPEVVAEACKALDAAVATVPGLALTVTERDAGVGLYARTGEALPAETYDAVRAADATLLGAMGLPDVRAEDGTEIQGRVTIGLRKSLGLYGGVRPIKLYPGITPRINGLGPVDLVVVRENTEGLFASFDGGADIADLVVGDTALISRAGTERVTRRAFELAAARSGRPVDGSALVTCVDKANIFRSQAFFRRVFTEVATGEYPSVLHEFTLVDALSLSVLQRPETYDVLVTENMFGDIISDLATVLIGGLGMAPSGDIGDRHALFQPSHGSAPDLVGQGVANPLATVLSAAMMLDWLADQHDDPAARAAARVVDSAVATVTAQGMVTPDLGGNASTVEVGDAVAAIVRESSAPRG